MTRFFIALAFFLSATLSAQESVLVFPDFDHYENFRDAYIAPEGRGFAVGSCEKLYRTTDNGNSWSVWALPLNTIDVTAVQCAPGTNCSEVYLTTNRGVYRSTDGGDTWAEATNRQFSEMDFSLPGVIHGYRSGGIEFYRSTDGGVSWTGVATPRPIIDDMFFTTSGVHAMMADSSFFRSEDAGTTWTKTFDFPNKPVLGTTDDEGNYYVETRDRDIYKSTDGGFTWTVQAENAHQYTAWYDMYKDAEDSLHVISFNGICFSSGDDGATWSRVRRTVFQRYSKFRRGEGRMFAAGDGLGLYAGTADYNDMAPLVTEKTIDFRDIVFHDEQTGYAFGEDGEVVRTTDGGASWAHISTIGDWMGNRPKVAPNGTIYGVQSITNFSRSTDQGSTWNELQAVNQALEGGRRVFDVLPNNEVVIMTNQRTVRIDEDNNILSARDGGHPSTSGGTFDLRMINADLGFIIRWARLDIYRTQDGGVTWDTIPQFGGNNFFSWFEIEDESTFLIGNGSSSWRTTDAGQTWEEFSTFTALGRFDVDDDLYGFERNSLYRSRDEGENWEEMFRTCARPTDIARRPGANELFLVYPNGIERIDLNEILSPVRQPRPQPVALRTVPNPTSGAVAVTVPEPSGRAGTIHLFDLSGRKINVGYTQNGEQLMLDLSGLSTGVYVVRYAASSGLVYQSRVVKQ